MPQIGIYPFQRTSLDAESFALITFDFSKRHEIIAGATVTSAVVRVMQNNAASSDLTLTSQAIDGTGKLVNVRVTDTGAGAVGNEYQLVCKATFSDTTVDVEEIGLTIRQA
jgi:hypothetical protein